MKKILYTANIGNYDDVKPFEIFNEDWDYVLFTDNPEFKSDFWDVRLIEPENDNTRTARHIKLFPSDYLGEHDVSVWVDSNIQQDCNLNDLVDKYLTEPLAIRNHVHNCIYKEADACLSLRKGDIEEIRRQMRQYIKDGYPSGNGQVETGIIIRRSGYAPVDEFMNLWWCEIDKHSYRDQLSFMKVLWDNPIPVNFMPYDVIEKDFILNFHIKDKVK